MTLPIPTRGHRNRSSSDPTSRIALFSLAFLLILSQLCSLSSAHKTNAAASRWPPPRKSRFFSKPPFLSGASPSPVTNSRKSSSINPDKFYDEEKRLVHTGPNPLHN